MVKIPFKIPVCIAIRITAEFQSAAANHTSRPVEMFHRHALSTFWVILLTDRQTETNRETNNETKATTWHLWRMSVRLVTLLTVVDRQHYCWSRGTSRRRQISPHKPHHLLSLMERREQMSQSTAVNDLQSIETTDIIYVYTYNTLARIVGCWPKY